MASLAIVATFAAFSGCGGGGGGGSSSVSSTAPSATSSAFTTMEDVATSSTLIASDPDGDPLTYSIATAPSMGSAVITDVATGAFTYTPDPEKTGTDDFSFKASDGSSDSNTATVAITILADNDAPVAQAGTLATDEDTPAPGTLVANDPDGDPLKYSIAGQPGKGSVVITGETTGNYKYTPDPDQNGPDSFTFSATDPDSAFLTYRLNEDGSGLSGPISSANGGTVEISNQNTGEFTYLPASGATGRGRDSFTYQVTDDDDGVSSATQTIIVGQTIMPLGDSITQGSVWNGVDFGTDESRVGYRKPLFEMLKPPESSEYAFDFVGSLSSGSEVLSDSQHEGHGGWTAFDIAVGRNLDGSDGVYAWLDLNPADIILLHAGTNDFNNTTEFDIEYILNEIDRWENSDGGNPVTVILARIIDQDPFNGVVTTFNDNVQAMAYDRVNNPKNPAYPDDIILPVDVDQQAALDYSADMSDDVHPNDSGYGKMANVWLDALTKVNPKTDEIPLDKCP